MQMLHTIQRFEKTRDLVGKTTFRLWKTVGSNRMQPLFWPGIWRAGSLLANAAQIYMNNAESLNV